jgi:hypothetical protein
MTHQTDEKHLTNSGKYFVGVVYYRLHTSAASSLKKKKFHNPQATGQNKSENCGPTTGRIDSAAVGRIKGIPIHPPEGSCSGYPLIPYSAASEACSRRCVNPAAKKTAFYLAPAARLVAQRGGQRRTEEICRFGKIY